MKILNKIIEESEMFGKELFGTAFGNEPDTDIENDIYSSLYNFFETEQNNIDNDTRKEIENDIIKLFKNKELFPDELVHSDRPIYRYTKYNEQYTYKIDFDETFKSIQDENEQMIHLGSILDYGTNTNISSWTVKPLINSMLYFMTPNTILLKSEKYDNTVVTWELSDKIKRKEGLDDNEMEVIKVTHKKPEKVDIVLHKQYPMNYNKKFLERWLDFLNSKLDIEHKVKFEMIFDITNSINSDVYTLNTEKFLEVYPHIK